MKARLRMGTLGTTSGLAVAVALSAATLAPAPARADLLVASLAMESIVVPIGQVQEYTQEGATTQTVASDISGAGGVLFDGPLDSVFNVTGTNTYSGTTTLSGATTVETFGQGIGDLSAVTLGANTILSVNNSETIGSLAGSGAALFNTLNAGGNNSSTTMAGDMIGLVLNKQGTGTMTLNGSLNLIDSLTVQSGTLHLVSANGVLANSVTVASGGTLQIDAGSALSGQDEDGNGLLETGVAAGGTLDIDGSLRSNVASAGTVTGNGTLTGTLTNNGVVIPGSAGTGALSIVTLNQPDPEEIVAESLAPGAVVGFAQGANGTLRANLAAAASPVAGTHYAQLAITGGAELDGTLAIVPALGAYVDGATYDIITTTQGMDGDFAEITGERLSAFVGFTPSRITGVGGSETYRLTVSRITYAEGISPGATPNQLAVANGLQEAVVGATGDMATVILGVDNMSVAQARSFFDQASPEFYGAFATALQDQGEFFLRQVDNRLADARATGFKSAAWGRAYYLWGDGKDRDFRFGTDTDVGGGAFGFDLAGENTLAGLAFGYSQGDLDYRLGATGKNKSWQIGAYVAYLWDKWSADLKLAYIDGSFDGTHALSAGLINRSAQADFGGSALKMAITVGHNFRKGGTYFRPFVGMDLVRGKVRGFTETGAGAASLIVDSIDADSARLKMGMELTANIGGRISPYLRGAMNYELQNNARAITAAFAGNPGARFTVEGVRPKDWSFDADAGINLKLSDRASLYLGYQGRLRGDLDNHGISGGLRINLGGAPAAAPPAPPPPPPAPPPPPPPPPPPAVPGPFTIFFDWNQDAITPEAADILRNAAAAYKETGQASVQLEGYADTSGGIRYNDGLSVRRAANAKAFMIAEGVPEAVIGIKAFGETNLLVPTPDGTREAQNRRVEISFPGQ